MELPPHYLYYSSLKKQEKMIKIGIQGARGSFSEEAAEVFARNHGIDEYELLPLISSDGVMCHLVDGSIDFGVIAMENAQGGVVIESIIALAHYQCDIVEMFHIMVKQNLLARRGMHIGDITEIHSHQQAIRQCRNYLSDHFWTRPLIEEDDTAEAARRLMEGKIPETAAVIGSRTCAELYDLAILQEDIHDLKNNLTLFVGLKKFIPGS